MSTYAQTYTGLLDTINKKYLPYNNLLQLKNYRNKVNCYKENSKQADMYYECFQKAELKIAEQSQSFTKNYHFIQDEYKACEKNCIASYTGNDAVRKECSEKCGSQFSKSTLELYDNFYKSQLGNEPQFKKIRK